MLNPHDRSVPKAAVGHEMSRDAVGQLVSSASAARKTRLDDTEKTFGSLPADTGKVECSPSQEPPEQ
jgi:hypothetical protein